MRGSPYRFSSHLIKSADLNPDPNTTSETSKHFNKDFYSSVLDFDKLNEEYVEFYQY
jgi:hypothetical protein